MNLICLGCLTVQSPWWAVRTYWSQDLYRYTMYSSFSFILCVKRVFIRSYSGPSFLAFGLNMERNSVSLRIQSECGKMRTRITLNTENFYAVIPIVLLSSIISVIKCSNVFKEHLSVTVSVSNQEFARVQQSSLKFISSYFKWDITRKCLWWSNFSEKYCLFIYIFS